MNNQKFISSSFFYLLSAILSQIINLVLIPIYTRNMTSLEFGQYNLIISLQSLLSVFITLEIFAGFCRFFNEVKDKNKLKNTVLTFSILWGSLCCYIFGCLLSRKIAYIIFKDDILGLYYVRYVVVNAVILSVIAVYTSYYSMLYKAKEVCIINTSQIFLTLCFTYYYLIVAQCGILGVLKAQLISFSIVWFILFFLDIKNYKIVLSKEELKKMIIYGIGIVPGEISVWILNLVDRYFIKGMINLNAVAIYSMGYKIGLLIEPLFLKPFRSLFTPLKFSLYKEKQGKVKIRSIFNYFNFIAWFIILGLSVFSSMAIKILSTEEYSQSCNIVTIIAFSYYLWGLAEFYALGLQIANKMCLDSLIVTVSALFNIILNYVFIPIIGIHGAAFATCIAYLLSNVLYYLIGRKYFNIGINLLQPYKYGVIYMLLYFIYVLYKLNVNNILLELLLNVIICAMYVVLCIIFKMISYNHVKKIILNFVKKGHNR